LSEQNSPLALDRRAFIGALLAGGSLIAAGPAGATSAASPVENRLAFDIRRDGASIGGHRVAFRRDGDRLKPVGSMIDSDCFLYCFVSGTMLCNLLRFFYSWKTILLHVILSSDDVPLFLCLCCLLRSLLGSVFRGRSNNLEFREELQRYVCPSFFNFILHAGE